MIYFDEWRYCFTKPLQLFLWRKKNTSPELKFQRGSPAVTLHQANPSGVEKKHKPRAQFSTGFLCSNAARSQPLLPNPCADTTIRKKGKTFRKRQKVFFCISTNGDTVLQNHFTFFLWRGKKHKPRAQISTGMRVMCVELLAS